MSRVKIIVLLIAMALVCVTVSSCKKKKEKEMVKVEEKEKAVSEEKITDLQPAEFIKHPATDAYEGWRLGIQCWTFKKFTFFEAVDKTAELGLDWIEAYPGQSLSKEEPDLKFIHTMSKATRRKVKKKLQNAGVKLINYGVVNIPNNENECLKIFDFAKDMGIEIITSEPVEEAFGLIDKYCQDYKIKLAIHNHPTPSRYANPEKVLEVCKDRSELIGACADTGHWPRSGHDPVESLKLLKGRINSLHLKDIEAETAEKAGKDRGDLIYGQGVCDVKSILAELDNQKFKGMVSIEYEANWENSMGDLRECIKYFNEVAGDLQQGGWKNLFADDLSDATFEKGSWTYEDGVLTANGDSDIWTKEKYGDFMLDLEFKLSENSNSGVFVRTADIKNVLSGIEVQIHESTDGTTYGACGSIYDCLVPKKLLVREAGLWNHYTIACQDNKIYVVFNGEQIIDMDLDEWSEAGKNPDGTPNKFSKALKDYARSGYIGLQYHGSPVWFRNIKIKVLD
jgi:sugar phosphate isomerase/epimerase